MNVFVAVSSLVLAVGSVQVAAEGDHHLKAAHDYAFGSPGDPSRASSTVEIDVTDGMRFTPPSVTVKKGEPIRFVVKNSGPLKHEMVLDTFRELREHTVLMAKCPEMEQRNPNQLTLEPGQTGELVWQFTKVGTFDFVCLRPTHFDAGMRGRIVVN
jgi:uncharacterized cupredoxin-like copper-binding protein